MAKHTKGPWSFRTDARTGDNGIVADGTGVFVECFAEIRRAGENARDEALANARLVAAAPDLLTSCTCALGYLTQGMDGDFKGDEDPVEVLRGAIAKATA